VCLYNADPPELFTHRLRERCRCARNTATRLNQQAAAAASGQPAPPLADMVKNGIKKSVSCFIFARMAHLQDPKLPDMSDAARRERVLERIWNEPQKCWTERTANVVIADGFFEKGAMRAAFKMKFVDDPVRGDRFYVAKLALRTQDRRQEQVWATAFCLFGCSCADTFFLSTKRIARCR
jgi:hypothetical protein